MAGVMRGPQLKRDEHFMRLAIEQAELGVNTPGGAEVGCVLMKDGELVCAGFNEAELRHDPTAHAEMVTIRRLAAEWQTLSLAGCTLYCTLQPCGMCTVASVWSGISRIVYGAGRAEAHAMYFVERRANAEDLIRDAFRNDIEIVAGVLADECGRFYLGPEETAPPEPDPAHAPTVEPG
jgi:tRNA(adenine34) deaminase